MTQYLVGETKTVTLAFVDEAGTPSNPDTISLKISLDNGNGTATTLATLNKADLDNPAIGSYEKTYTFAQEGKYVFDVVTTGTPKTRILETVAVIEPYTYTP